MSLMVLSLEYKSVDKNKYTGKQEYEMAVNSEKFSCKKKELLSLNLVFYKNR